MANTKSMIKDLTTGSVSKKLITFAYPFMLSNLLQVVYNLVDMIVIGQVVGSKGLSGVSIGGDLLQFCTMLCIGFASAGQIMISQSVGKGDRETVNSIIGTMFSSLLSFSILLSIVTICLADTFLVWMQTPAEAFEQARAYSIVCFAGLFFVYGYNVVSSILRGMGDSMRPFIFIAIAAVMNFLLDLLFIAVLGMEAFGAALATVLGQAFSFVASIIYLYRRKEAFGFDFKIQSFKVRFNILKPMIKLGFPLALQYAAISISMLFVNSYINSFGLVASAVTGVGNKLRQVMSIITRSIATAGSSMVGQNMGAGKPERVKQMVRTACIICFSAAIVFSCVFLAFPKQIFSIFDKNPEVLDWAPRYMVTIALAFGSFAVMAPFNALINGTGFAALSFVIALLDGVVSRIGLSLLLGLTFKMGIEGFWYGSALAGYSTGLVGAVYYLSGKWKTRKLIISK
ncbi:MAG TPA: MATE family efflux transporter [Clostridiales bacterium]|jgi:putative MATE family efflux protein|nr:MATE family efflux transporter [Clostridiales bacterium]